MNHFITGRKFYCLVPGTIITLFSKVFSRVVKTEEKSCVTCSSVFLNTSNTIIRQGSLEVFCWYGIFLSTTIQQ